MLWEDVKCERHGFKLQKFQFLWKSFRPTSNDKITMLITSRADPRKSSLAIVPVTAKEKTPVLRFGRMQNVKGMVPNYKNSKSLGKVSDQLAMTK